MPIFDHFQILAPFYDRFIQGEQPEDLIHLAELPIRGTLLDAGGGTGRVSYHLRDKVGDIIVADLSMNMLSQARKKGMSGTVCSRTEQLPFPDGYFDRIIMVDALHHVYDQQSTAADLWRVLKPGGKIVIEEPDIENFRVKIVAFFEKVALMRSRFLSPQEIAGLFDFPGVESSIERNDYNSWVVVRKN